MRSHLVLAAAALLSGPALGQVKLLKDVEYARVGSRRLLADVYMHENATPRGCVVWLHWGGWRSGHRSNGRTDGADLAAKGLAVVLIDYRLSSEAKWPAQLHDCKGAIRWIRANAAAYNIDPDRIAAFGHSAGGHLAAMLGTTGGVASLEGTVGGNLDESSRVDAVAAFAPPTDLLGPTSYEPPDSFVSELIGKPIGEIKRNLNNPNYAQWVALARSANPINYVSRDDPPFFLAHGQDDSTVPPNQSKLLHDALRAAGVTSSRDLIDTGHNLPAFVWVKRRGFLLIELATDIPYRVYGKGCGAAGADEPASGSRGPAFRGKFFDYTLTAAPPQKPAVTMFCIDRALVPLGFLGASGCAFLVNNPFVLHFTATDANGLAEANLPLPSSSPAGVVIHGQWVVLQPAANKLGIVMSNAARIKIL